MTLKIGFTIKSYLFQRAKSDKGDLRGAVTLLLDNVIHNQAMCQNQEISPGFGDLGIKQLLKNLLTPALRAGASVPQSRPKTGFFLRLPE
jgi:hypothetical protein